MRSVTWRTALRGSISAAALLLVATVASATDIVAVPPPDKGTLYLETVSGKLQFRWAQVAPNSPVVQKIIDKSWTTWKPADFCTLVLNPATTAPTATTPGVGLVNLSAGAGFIGDHIGVKGTGYCSEISGAETLTIALGGQLDGYQVYRTELNLEMKSNAVARIDTTFGSLTQTFIIQSPGSTIPPTAVIPPGATIINCAFETAPQEKDICRWNSDAFWSSASIKALTGVVVVEGGSGGGGGKFSQFSITQLKDTLACAPATGLPVPGLTAAGPGGSVAVGTRLTNTDPNQTCKPIPAALTWSNDASPKLQFFKADLGQSVATTFTIIWPNADVPVGGLAAIPLSTQQFVPNENVPIDLCVGTPIFYIDPLFPSVNHVEQFVLTGLTNITADDQAAAIDGFQYGCTYDRRVTYPVAGKYGLKEFIYLQGDWTAKRS